MTCETRGSASHTVRACFILLILSNTAFSASVEWARQLGTSGYDDAFSVSTDGVGNAYITGWTDGALGALNAGSNDAFVAKYDGLGNNLWTRQIGSSAFDGSLGVSAAGGSVFITGWTAGSLGGANAGSNDAFLCKLDSSGNFIWTRQFGTSQDDRGMAAASDAMGNIYVGGLTFGSLGGPNAGASDALLRKYDTAGNVVWTRQFGTNLDDRSYGVATDAVGHVYLVGNNNSSSPLSGGFAFINQYDSSGNLLWTRQFGGGGYSVANEASVDALGNVYVAGAIPAGAYSDAFLSKYDILGNLIWTKQFGTFGADWAQSVSVSLTDGIYVTGATNGVLGDSSVGGNDVYVRKYDSAGNVVWTQQFGSSTLDEGYGVSTDSLGNVFVAGDTDGNLAGPSLGQWDAFVAKISEVPEPASILLLAVGVFFAAATRVSVMRGR